VAPLASSAFASLGPLAHQLGRRSLAGGATELDESFFFNASSGYSGELEKRLDAVARTWEGGGTNGSAPLSPLGTFTGNTYEASFGLMQLGFFAVFPYFLELWLEDSLAYAAYENLRLIFMGSWVFFLFTAQTKGFRFAEAIRIGKAGYVATGRGYVIEPGSFISLYAVYAKSHIYSGVEVVVLLIMYHAFSESDTVSAAWTLWLYAIAMLLAPYIFNPQSLSITTIGTSFDELRAWLAGDADPNSKDHHGAWSRWHRNRLQVVRDGTLLAKTLDHTRIMLLRFALLLSTAARLNIQQSSQPSYRLLTLLGSGGLFLGGAALVYILACERTCCGGAVRRGLRKGSIWLEYFYLFAVFACTVALVWTLQYELAHRVCTYNWTAAGRSNGLLLSFAGALMLTYVLQLLVTLRPPPAEGPRGFLAPVWALLIDFADFWYFVMDAVVTMLLINLILLLAMLPLLSVQSLILFNRDFAKVIATKLRRAELLKRIVA